MLMRLHVVLLNGALCRFGEEMQTHNFNIQNIIVSGDISIFIKISSPRPQSAPLI